MIDDATVHLHQLDESVPNSTVGQSCVKVLLNPRMLLGSKCRAVRETLASPPAHGILIVSMNWQRRMNHVCEAGTFEVQSFPHSTPCLIQNALRSSFAIDQAHSVLVRSIDFNSNKPNYIVTAGDDCKIRFWDVRNTKQCLKQISGHSHWFAVTLILTSFY